MKLVLNDLILLLKKFNMTWNQTIIFLLVNPRYFSFVPESGQTFDLCCCRARKTKSDQYQLCEKFNFNRSFTALYFHTSETNKLM